MTPGGASYFFCTPAIHGLVSGPSTTLPLSWVHAATTRSLRWHSPHYQLPLLRMRQKQGWGLKRLCKHQQKSLSIKETCFKPPQKICPIFWGVHQYGMCCFDAWASTVHPGGRRAGRKAGRKECPLFFIVFHQLFFFFFFLFYNSHDFFIFVIILMMLHFLIFHGFSNLLHHFHVVLLILFFMFRDVARCLVTFILFGC